MQLIFDKFDEMGSANAVLRFLQREGLRIGVRQVQGAERGLLRLACSEAFRQRCRSNPNAHDSTSTIASRFSAQRTTPTWLVVVTRKLILAIDWLRRSLREAGNHRCSPQRKAEEAPASLPSGDSDHFDTRTKAVDPAVG